MIVGVLLNGFWLSLVWFSRTYKRHQQFPLHFPRAAAAAASTPAKCKQTKSTKKQILVIFMFGAKFAVETNRHLFITLRYDAFNKINQK